MGLFSSIHRSCKNLSICPNALFQIGIALINNLINEFISILSRGHQLAYYALGADPVFKHFSGLNWVLYLAKYCSKAASSAAPVIEPHVVVMSNHMDWYKLFNWRQITGPETSYKAREISKTIHRSEWMTCIVQRQRKDDVYGQIGKDMQV